MKAKIKVPATHSTTAVSKEEELIKTLQSEMFTVIDIETSGYAPEKGSEIIEVAAVKIIRGRVVDTYDTLVQPRGRVPAKITQITGIKNEDLAGQPLIEKVLPELFHFIGDGPVVAHNASFEERFLNHYFKRSGYQLQNEWVCTMKLFRKLYPERKKMGLGATLMDLTEHYGVDFGEEDHHRALPDTIATADAFLEMRKEFIEPELIQEELLLDTDDIANFTPKPLNEVSKFNFVSVRYWEKNFNAKRDQWARRLYIHFSSTDNVTGTVYYDLYSKEYIVQSCQNKFTKEDKPINLNAFKYLLLEHLEVDDIQTYLKELGVFKKAQEMFKARVKDKMTFLYSIFPDAKDIHYNEHVKGEIPYDVFGIELEDEQKTLLVTNEKRGSKYRYFETPEDIK